jgi:ankyrin repeat protein
VWEFAGALTLAERFFLPDCSTTPFLSITAKRAILEKLRVAVAMLSNVAVTTQPCCCRDDDLKLCSVLGDPNDDGLWSSIKKKLMSCPVGTTESPHMCGAITHHDIKFDNVMLIEGSSSDIEPVLIDFGTAARCAAGQAESFTPDWLPFWWTHTGLDPLVLPPDCWSYDLYAVGLSWLVTELLRGLECDQLVCEAAARGRMTMRTYAIEVGLQDKPHAHCVPPPTDWQMRQNALVPVNALVRDLRKALLQEEDMYNASDFVAFVKSFVAKSHDDEGMLHLTLPPEAILISDVWPLLQECPSPPTLASEKNATQPASVVRKLADVENAALKCRLRAATRVLNQDIAKHRGAERIRQSAKRLQVACANLQMKCGSEETQALVRIVSEGAVDELEHFLDATTNSVGFSRVKAWSMKAWLNEWVLDGDTLVAIAARRGDKEMVKKLVSYGADALQRNIVSGGFDGTWSISRMSALLAAATVPKNSAVLKYLLDTYLMHPTRHGVVLGATPKALKHIVSHLYVSGNNAGPSIISLAAVYGDVKMVRLILRTLRKSLISFAVPQLLRGDATDIPLLRAAAAGKAETCKFLLTHPKVNASAVDAWGRTALMLAVQQSGDVETVRSIASSHLTLLVNVPVSDIRSTPLHVAAAAGSAEMVRVLLYHGADVTAQDAKGNTPLQSAVLAGESALPALRFIAQVTAAQRATNDRGMTELVLVASQCANTDVFKVLLDTAEDAALYIPDHRGYLATHAAAAEGRLSCLLLAMERIALSTRVATGDHAGNTAFMIATRFGQAPTMLKLLEMGANVLDFDADGRPVGMLIGWQAHGKTFSATGIEMTLVSLALQVGPAFLYEIDSRGMSVIGRFIFDGEVDVISLLMKWLDCNSTVLRVTANPAFVQQRLGPSDIFSAGTRFTPMMLVRYRLLLLERQKVAPFLVGEFVSERDVSYMAAGYECGKKIPSLVCQGNVIAKLTRMRTLLEDRGCRVHRNI